MTVILFSVVSLTAFAESAESVSVAESASFFDEAYAFLTENADKIFSALACLSSFALALIYRRSLIPILKGGLGTLSGTVKELREDTEKAESASRDILEAAAVKLEYAEKVISELTEKLSEIESELRVTKEEEKRAADLRLILGMQIDLLHDIFMASSLPYYRKEEVGEKVSEMKKALAAEDGGDE